MQNRTFIQQAYNGKIGRWKYLIPAILFFGLMGLNILVSTIMDIDQSKIIADQIERDGKNFTFFTLLAPFAVLLGLLFIYVKLVHKQSIRSLTTSRKKIDWSRVWFGFILVAILITAMTVGDYLLRPEAYEMNFNFSQFIILAAIAIILVPLQTSFEEYMFRGYLMQGIGVISKYRWVALFVTSLIFGLMHFANPEVSMLGPVIMISYIGTGFLLGIMTLMDEGMELALGFHAGNNLITALLVTANWTAFQTDSVLIYTEEPTAGFDVLIPVFVIYPIYLFIMAKKYKWSNWKSKLFGKVQPVSDK
ncbi:CPBP family intramembrane glutamic endopeptidase [Psychroflexus aestuariivivens]|uniref:CPBP family intramembrane glutamic endopeptidase n=1 Tax=Psychroflexus aestuariivivens TaxID=1795040 RepID=UPI000FDA0F4C|nr:type II CAAX endopeptidase family protein [Psychroflexus aestuariivivens]